MYFDLQPVLENEAVVLRPLKEEDFEALYQVASDPLIWEQHPDKDRCERPVFEKFFQEAMQSGGAFLVLDKKTGEVIGSTRFFGWDEGEKSIEIGWTFLARRFWGGQHNRAMKALMMNHAFKFVENIVFYIHEHNFRSQRAVEKLGAERASSSDPLHLSRRSADNVTFTMNREKWRSSHLQLGSDK